LDQRRSVSIVGHQKRMEIKEQEKKDGTKVPGQYVLSVDHPLHMPDEMKKLAGKKGFQIEILTPLPHVRRMRNMSIVGCVLLALMGYWTNQGTVKRFLATGKLI